MNMTLTPESEIYRKGEMFLVVHFRKAGEVFYNYMKRGETWKPFGGNRRDEANFDAQVAALKLERVSVESLDWLPLAEVNA